MLAVTLLVILAGYKGMTEYDEVAPLEDHLAIVLQGQKLILANISTILPLSYNLLALTCHIVGLADSTLL